ncbi:MAG: hypothetical protein ACREDR_06415 [Blastocatellia bacterium]
MKERESKLREQRELISELRSRFTFADIGKMAGVTGVQAQFWGAGRYLARETNLMQLRRMAEALKRGGFMPMLAALERQDVSQGERAAQRTQKPTPDDSRRMRTPNTRAREIRRLIDQSGMSGVEFGEAIGIISTTLYKYLDPNWKGKIASEVLRRIAEFRKALDGPGVPTAKERLRTAVETVLKLRSGVPKTVLAQEIGKLSGVSWRTALRQMFPKERWPRPNPRVLSELERIARER